MAKGKILSDTFEQLAEFSASTAKKTVESVAGIVNPFSNESNKTNEAHKTNSPESNLNKNHTPVDFKELQKKFENKDKIKAEALARQFFQNVKREDQKILDRKEMEEQQKERQEEQEVQDKKRREQQQKAQNQEIVSTGKTKRGVAKRKKAPEQQHVENKPASGKQ